MGDEYRECEHCGLTYKVRAWNQKYCSQTCGFDAMQARFRRRYTAPESYRREEVRRANAEINPERFE